MNLCIQFHSSEDLKNIDFCISKKFTPKQIFISYRSTVNEYHI